MKSPLILVALVLTFVTASVPAQESPRFFIERIEVRSASRVSTDVIVAESRLREGHEYSEADFSDAAARLSRLPFLLSADFSLEKGSERGRHVLVITVTETKPFFYLLDFVPIFSSGYDSNSQIDVIDNDRSGVSQNKGVIGARWFVGRRGAFHTGLYSAEDQHDFTRDYTAAVIGYTQYDLFGTRAFATVNLKRPLLDSAGATLSPQLVVGIPISPNQTLTLTYDETRFETDTFEFFNGATADRRDGDRLISARMTYNTTNHPFLPTNGTLLSVTPLVAWRDGSSFHVVVDGPDPEDFTVIPVTHHQNSWGVELDAARYEPLSEQNSVWVRAEGGWGRVRERDDLRDQRRDSRYGVLSAGFSHSLWTGEQQKRGDSRFEWSLRYSTRDDGFGSIYGYDPDRVQLAFSWVRRSSFGTIRLGVGHAW